MIERWEMERRGRSCVKKCAGLLSSIRRERQWSVTHGLSSPGVKVIINYSGGCNKYPISIVCAIVSPSLGMITDLLQAGNDLQTHCCFPPTFRHGFSLFVCLFLCHAQHLLLSHLPQQILLISKLFECRDRVPIITSKYLAVLA